MTFPSPGDLLWIMAWLLGLFALAASALFVVGVVGSIISLVDGYKKMQQRDIAFKRDVALGWARIREALEISIESEGDR